MTQSDYNTSREAMLLQVTQAGFALDDAQLYLDTHPCDVNAMAYFNQMAERYRNAVAAFQALYGPLMAYQSSDTAYWSWGNDPWPWEGGCT